MGRSITGAGDLNQDGVLDLAIGAKLSDRNGADSGAVFLYYGPLSGTYTAAHGVISGAVAGDETGISIDVIGDGLQAKVDVGGINWSVGQRQLICLARALCQRSKVLILDECSASVDSTTDGILQDMIRTEFAKCTVLTIAHRLETVNHCDKVLVFF